MEGSEHQHQCEIFRWSLFKSNLKKWPELLLLNGSLNGVRLKIGQAVKAKKAGMKAGFPDINLPVARCGYHQLYIELKVGKNKMSEDQLWWKKQLEKQGNYHACCWGAEEAVEVIKKYLKGEV